MGGDTGCYCSHDEKMKRIRHALLTVEKAALEHNATRHRMAKQIEADTRHDCAEQVRAMPMPQDRVVYRWQKTLDAIADMLEKPSD